MVAGGGFYSYYIHQGNKSDKKRKIVRKMLSFMHTKSFNIFFKRWGQFRVGAIPRRLPSYKFVSFNRKKRPSDHESYENSSPESLVLLYEISSIHHLYFLKDLSVQIKQKRFKRDTLEEQ